MKIITLEMFKSIESAASKKKYHAFSSGGKKTFGISTDDLEEVIAFVRKLVDDFRIEL